MFGDNDIFNLDVIKFHQSQKLYLEEYVKNC